MVSVEKQRRAAREARRLSGPGAKDFIGWVQQAAVRHSRKRHRQRALNSLNGCTHQLIVAVTDPLTRSQPVSRDVRPCARSTLWSITSFPVCLTGLEE